MKLFYIVICISFCFVTQAQNTIKGIIQNSQGEAVDYAEIFLLNSDKVFVKNTFTDEGGNFLLDNISEGGYLLQINYFGELLEEQKIKVNDDISLGIIKVNNSSQLSEIVLEGRQKMIERKVDRMVFNVENSVVALGGDVLGALKNTPNLTVTNKGVNIAGKNSVSVMINDRIVKMEGEELMNYLKSIPSSNIKKIEVITNPPSKYDATGNSGLVNIVLIDAKADSWSSTVRTSYEQATYATFGNGINLLYDKKKFSALVDIYQYDYNSTVYSDINYQYPNEDWREQARGKTTFRGLGGLTTLNYKIDDKNRIGLQYNGGFDKAKNKAINTIHSYSNADLVKNYITTGENKGGRNYNSINLNYDYKFDTIGKKISLDLDYSTYNGNRDNAFRSDMNNILSHQYSITDALNNSDQKINNFSGKGDFYMPYDFGVLEYGIKAAYTETNYNIFSDFRDVISDQTTLSQMDKFNYRESIQALYGSYSLIFSDKWNAKIGFRGEYTQTKSNSIQNNQIEKDDYFKIFPTAFLQYKPNDNHSFNINFGRRIQRPEFWEMNPNRWYTNAVSYSEGNPFLQPAFIYNIELNYGYSDYLNFKTYYQNTQEGFGQIIFHDLAIQTQVIKRLNYYKSHSLGTTISSSLNPFSWWQSNNEFGWRYSKTNNDVSVLANEYSGSKAYIRSFNSFVFSTDKSFLGEVNFRYNFAGKENELSLSPRYYLNIGLKKLFFDKKLTLGLTFEDILRRDYSKFSLETQGIKQSFEEYYDTQLVRLSMSYRFGNSNISVSKRQTSNQDEVDRVGK